MFFLIAFYVLKSFCATVYVKDDLNCGETYEDVIDHRSYVNNLSSCEIKAWKKIQAWMGYVRTHDNSDTGAVLYRLSYQASPD